jgi:RNA polymerase sigma-B factor
MRRVELGASGSDAIATMTQTHVARLSPSLHSESERRSTNEYARLSLLFMDMARLPEGHRRRSGLRDRLIIEHLPLAQHIAWRFVRRGEPRRDLEQVATVGLINAVDRFDPDRGCEFLAFAVPTITGEVQRWFRDRAWSMRVPRRLKELDRSISTAVGQLSQELCRAPRPSEIAAWLDIAVAEVIEGLQVHNAHRCVSLDEPLSTEPSDGSLHASTLGELDPGVALVEDWATLSPLLDALAERERRIVLLRFFGNMTQTQIAQEVGVSQMHVSRLLAATLKGLRLALTADT